MHSTTSHEHLLSSTAQTPPTRLLRWIGVWARDWGGAMMLLFAVYVLGYVIWLFSGWGGDENRVLISDIIYWPTTFPAVILAARAALYPSLGRRTRLAWGLIALANLATSIGDTLWLYYEVIVEEPPFPSWADAAFLGFYPFALWGLLLFPGPRRSPAERIKFWLDTATVMVGAGMVLWYFILAPIAMAEYSDLLSAALSIAYPVGDLVILFGITTILLGRARQNNRNALFLLVASMVSIFCADLAFSYLQLQGTYVSGSWVDPIWMLGYFLLALSAQSQCWQARLPDTSATTAPAMPSFSLLPYSAIALGYGLLLFVLFNQWVEHLGDLIIGAVVLTALVVARQVAAVRENTRLLAEQEYVRTRAEQAIRQSEARFRSLVQNSSDAIMVVDRTAAIQYQTQSVQRILGYQPGELEGVALIDLVHEDEQPHARDFFALTASQDGPSMPVTWRLRHRDGHWLDVETIAANLLDDPNIRGIVLNTRDISERKAKEVAEAASRSKSVFLATMSHELRTPLTAIMGYCDLIALDAEMQGYGTVLPDLRQIQASSRHLMSLISDILDLSKIEAEKMELYPETFPIEPVLEEMLRNVLPLIERNSNTLEVQRGANLGTMYADQTKVRQMLYNLLSNAAKFTERGTISVCMIRARIEGAEWLQVRISDTGIGMTPEQTRYVFKPFTQADPSTTRKYGGTGLGLTLSRHFCEMMGGDISVESELGKGSTFTISLPIHSEADGRAPEDGTGGG
jgi:PAS domain S-box-containing protein